MSKAHGALSLCAALALAGLAAAIGATVAALTRIAFTVPTVSELVTACERWLVLDAGPASWLVLALSAVGAAVLGLAVRSALRQARDTRRFERRLPVVGALPANRRVSLLDDPVPQAFCAGLIRPRVYLSTGAVALLSGRERESVIAHECHHARVRDPLRILLARALADGLFFLPAVGRLGMRYATLAELAADEAAERATGDRRHLAAALLTLDTHQQRTVVGVASERIDRLLGQDPAWGVPVMPLFSAAAALGSLAALTALLLQGADHGSIALPTLIAEACMLAMAAVPTLLGAACVLGGRRACRR